MIEANFTHRKAQNLFCARCVSQTLHLRVDKVWRNFTSEKALFLSMECQECEGEFLLNSGSGEEEEGLSSLVVSR